MKTEDQIKLLEGMNKVLIKIAVFLVVFVFTLLVSAMTLFCLRLIQ